ncbi:MAG: hypothetical protein J5962_06190, partial [Lachnospiraceae bacterium]|nr:hypothetical protein [Lachnospiraceae bacterium]
PYQITTAAELALLAKDSETYKTSCFKLMNDIDLSDYEWVPIAEFDGIFDGNGKSITGLKIGASDAAATDLEGKPVGLFGTVTGTVKNLTVNAAIYVSDASDALDKAAGIIVGNLRGTIDNCIAEGTINVTRTFANVGGIAGTVTKGGKILNCGNKATVNGCGSVDDSTGDRNLRTKTRVGGIAGSAVIESGDTASLYVANSYNVGTVTATGGHNPCVGGVLGLIGKPDGATSVTYLYNCYNAGKVDITGSSAKGKIGNTLAERAPDVPAVINGQYGYGVNDSGFLSTGTHVSTVRGYGYETKYSLEVMQSETFLTTLNTNAAASSSPIAGLMSWQATTNGTPVMAPRATISETATLNIEVTGSEYGSVAVFVNDTKAAGTSPYVIETGNKVEVTYTPGTNCESVVAPDGSVEQADGSYVYTIANFASDTTLVVEFKGITSNKWPDYAATASFEGAGTEAEPYQITTAAELALLAKDSETYKTSCFKLMNDIDLSDYEWVPIAEFDGI